jgi:predicted metal-dependent peptidase
MTLVENNDLPTAATDGRKLYYNSKFINSLQPGEVVFLIGHEMLHCLYDHLGRFGTRDYKLSNIAADYVVNADLVEYKVGDKITTVGCLYDEKYKGMSFEEVYDDLYKNEKNIDIDDLLSKLLDEHMDASDMSEEEKSALKDEIREAMLSAAEAVGVDNVPLGIQRILKDLTEPQMNWKELLRQQIECQIKSDFSYARPSRRAYQIDAILPSMKKQPAVEAYVTIDTSGSIGANEMKDFFGEIKGIMESYESYSIHIGCWDTEFYGFTEFTSYGGEDIMEYVPRGGGGTDASCLWRHMIENDIRPSQLVMFTDMCIGANGWGDADYCPTLWIAHKSDTIAPHGQTVKYD